MAQMSKLATVFRAGVNNMTVSRAFPCGMRSQPKAPLTELRLPPLRVIFQLSRR
jgi:hypothetical protein